MAAYQFGFDSRVSGRLSSQLLSCGRLNRDAGAVFPYADQLPCLQVLPSRVCASLFNTFRRYENREEGCSNVLSSVCALTLGSTRTIMLSRVRVVFGGRGENITIEPIDGSNN